MTAEVEPQLKPRTSETPKPRQSAPRCEDIFIETNARQYFLQTIDANISTGIHHPHRRDTFEFFSWAQPKGGCVKIDVEYLHGLRGVGFT